MYFVLFDIKRFVTVSTGCTQKTKATKNNEGKHVV
jgi:hypothetical protein